MNKELIKAINDYDDVASELDEMIEELEESKADSLATKYYEELKQLTENFIKTNKEVF